MRRFYYANTISEFLECPSNSILGELALAGHFDLQTTQRDAWLSQLAILKSALAEQAGTIILEYTIPRMGSRIDVLLIISHVVFIIEFKVGTSTFDSIAIDQVHDYALDLHYFHEPSHTALLVPILIATDAVQGQISQTNRRRGLYEPLLVSKDHLSLTITKILESSEGAPVDPDVWMNGRYSPTPTIVEAATALYRGHSVEDISRSDAGGRSLRLTSDAVSKIIESSRDSKQKAICFLTGVPGAGKTLVGLNIANSHTDSESELYSVFLSGNGPLVDVLREALARDAINQARSRGERVTKGESRARVKQFIQNVHHFRDDCLSNPHPPIEHVALFDEAQRAWDLKQTASFMKRKRNQDSFELSEPEFLISCLDRHPDWSTIICLVGGGQEINTGEGGIGEWIRALKRFGHWRIYISPQLTDAEFDPGHALTEFESQGRVTKNPLLHLSTSMRSFRAENISHLVRALLEHDLDSSKESLLQCHDKYPIMITRSLPAAKAWIRSQARGTERYGVVVSSAAERLRPHAINVKAPIDPVHWFLDEKQDVRSSYYMEDVATEFHIQGLELDWTCVVWDADFRIADMDWQNYDFVQSRWQRIRHPDRQRYQKNAYRVLLTRARQGMVIVVPEGDPADHTRLPEFYDPTFEYLRAVGFQEL